MSQNEEDREKLIKQIINNPAVKKENLDFDFSEESILKMNSFNSLITDYINEHA